MTSRLEQMAGRTAAILIKLAGAHIRLNEPRRSLGRADAESASRQRIGDGSQFGLPLPAYHRATPARSHPESTRLQALSFTPGFI
jgi:hypothetical protein